LKFVALNKIVSKNWVDTVGALEEELVSGFAIIRSVALEALGIK